MPVVISENKKKLTPDKIRIFLRDSPEYNILLDDVEFTGEDIEAAIEMTLGRWNAITPVTNLTDYGYINPYVFFISIILIFITYVKFSK